MCYKQKCKVVSLNLAHPVDIDVKPAPQCAPESKDAETCKKSKSEFFAVTGSLHPTDDMLSAPYAIAHPSVRLSVSQTGVS